MSLRPVAPLVWFAGKEPVRRRLAELIGREQLDDFITVQPLPSGITAFRWAE